jgi:hypothetical protein
MPGRSRDFRLSLKRHRNVRPVHRRSRDRGAGRAIDRRSPDRRLSLKRHRNVRPVHRRSRDRGAGRAIDRRSPDRRLWLKRGRHLRPVHRRNRDCDRRRATDRRSRNLGPSRDRRGNGRLGTIRNARRLPRPPDPCVKRLCVRSAWEFHAAVLSFYATPKLNGFSVHPATIGHLSPNEHVSDDVDEQVSTGRRGESNRCDRPNDVTHSRVEWPATAPTSMNLLTGGDIGERQ